MQEPWRRAAESEFRARSVRYDAGLEALEVVTARNGSFVIPTLIIGVLRDVTPWDLTKLELWPDGSVVEIEDLDIHISVDEMLKAAFPFLVPQSTIEGSALTSLNSVAIAKDTR